MNFELPRFHLLGPSEDGKHWPKKLKTYYSKLSKRNKRKRDLNKLSNNDFCNFTVFLLLTLLKF